MLRSQKKRAQRGGRLDVEHDLTHDTTFLLDTMRHCNSPNAVNTEQMTGNTARRKTNSIDVPLQAQLDTREPSQPLHYPLCIGPSQPHYNHQHTGDQQQPFLSWIATHSIYLLVRNDRVSELAAWEKDVPCSHPRSQAGPEGAVATARQALTSTKIPSSPVQRLLTHVLRATHQLTL